MINERLDYRLAQAYLWGEKEECLKIIDEIEAELSIEIEAKDSVGEKLALENYQKSEVEETKKIKVSKKKAPVKKQNK